MASGTAADGGSIKMDSIPILDLRLLSQSELYSLSLCSSTAFDPRRCDDVVIPKIDRSVFNESAGSRKQTYSRLRLAPPSSSSSASTPRRRAPHLRPAATTFAAIQTDNSHPDNAENSHIVSLLKQLFVADLNPEELVPVKIDYSYPLPARQFSSLPTSSQSSVYPTGYKRKRGRPRRDEILRNEGGLALGLSTGDVGGDADGLSSLNDVFVHNNTEDRDREVLNKDGVAVDLVALGAVEHPYSGEIRCRTEGLTTEEELLEFLKGLSGDWNSRRKKKRVVDASEFGAALPAGWKLSLSVKKKNDQVWLYCRRYISPSGLHFVSCKGVSSYLLSLHGVQDSSLPNSFRHCEIINDVDKLTPITVTTQSPDLDVKDDRRKEELVSHTSSPANDSTSGNHEMQVVKCTDDFSKHGVGEILHCDKCNINFSMKDELLQHQSSHQSNILENSMCITDGVIIKDGKYECQFCHRTFDERHTYTGHVGTHIRCKATIAGESPAGVVGESVNPCIVGNSVDSSSFGVFPFQDTAMQGFLNSDYGENVGSLGNKDNDNVGYLKEANGNMKSVGDATDIVNKMDLCDVANVVLSSNSNESLHEDKNADACAVEITDEDSSFQGRRSGNCSLLPVDSTGTHGLKNDVTENSSGTQDPKQRVVSKSSLLDSNQHGQGCYVVSNGCISEARNEVELDSEKFSVNGSIFNFFGTHGVNSSTSGSVVSKLDVGPNVTMLPRSQDEHICGKDSDLIHKGKVDETCRFGICEKGSYQAANDAVSRHEEMQFDITSVIPTQNDQEQLPKKSGAEATTSPLKEHVVRNSCKRRLVALSDRESICDLENKDDQACGQKNKVSEFDHYQTSGNGELTDPFSSSHVELNSYSIMGTLQDRVCTDFSSTTNKHFFRDDNLMRIFDGALEEQRQGQPGGISMSPSGSDPGSHSKLNAILNTGKHELSLSFGNQLTELPRDSSRVEQTRYETDRVNLQSVDTFNSQSIVQRTFGDQTKCSSRNCSIPGDLDQERPDIPDSPFNIKTHELGSNFNAAHPGNQIGTSGQNFMLAFGKGSSQLGDCGTIHDSWRTGHENASQGTFDATARQQIPSSNCFAPFGLTSDKGEEGSFGLNKNHSIHTNMLKPGRTEPVEYRFLGEESANCIPGESNIFSHTPNLEQGIDPSFWLAKDALTPYTPQVSSICVWCRNMFLHQPDEFGTQTGAIGSMCPSCSSRIPGQFNVL